jgi:hypothetical protein
MDYFHIRQGLKHTNTTNIFATNLAGRDAKATKNDNS